MKNRAVSLWVDSFLAARKVRANSLIITIYGDSIAPHGGTVWLGSFIRLVEALGLNPRMVRTSVFRLAREQWLVSAQRGRKSYYSLTATGRRRFEHAYRRIYDQPQTQWAGGWQLVLTTSGKLTAAQRDALRKDLLWEGYGIIAPGVLAHPSDNSDSLFDILQGNGVMDQVVVMQGRTLRPWSSSPLQDLVHDCWNLEEIAADYLRYIERFRPLLHALKSARSLDPQQCFVVRTLLMHEFRRVLLRDPQLPPQLLPSDWPGDIARQICRELYSVTQCAAEKYLMDVLETAEGPLPAAAAYFYERFGGVLSKDCRQEDAIA
ncbi:MAG: phenylacetic acid degradation operon negative regulatory protein PaaX [Proteobacteria bacterium]|nr:phenylacetic acid degradation operon negative regulatory protein PaaX [Pseudomonadota bacterium]